MRDFTIGSGWVLVIVTPLLILALWLAIDHANANAARQQRHANAQFRQAQIIANHKFQQAIRIGASQSAYSINKSVCGFRSLLAPTLRDKRIPAARRNQILAFLETQVTVPSDFPCKTLPKNPPKARP